MKSFLPGTLARWSQLWASPLVLRRFHRPESIISIELRQRLPAIAWLALAVWYVAAPTEVIAVAWAGLSGLILTAWLWARAMAVGVTARRQLHYAAVQVGDELEERFSLDNRSRLPLLWAEFVDRSNLPGYTVASVRGVDGESVSNWRARAVCERRGLFVLGPWELRLGDPLGFFLVRQVYREHQELLVYPPLAQLPAHLQPHTSLVGDHLRLRQHLRADTLSATGARPYAPGDALRRIHWPTTARRSDLYSKVFEPEATSTIWLLPDFDGSRHLTAPDPAGRPSDSTEELMVLLAASLADHLLRRHLSVGLLAYADAPVVVAPRAGRGQLWPILRALAPLHPACPFNLSETLTRLLASMTARQRVVVITPSLDAAWPRTWLALGRRAGLDCMLIDPASFGGAGSATAYLRALAGLGIPAQAVGRHDLDNLNLIYGDLKRWEFMTLGTGRAIARQTPRLWRPEAVGRPHHV